MFGQGDQSNQQQDVNQIPDQTIDAAMGGNTPQPAALDNQPITPTDESWQHPGTPLDTAPSAPVQTATQVTPAPPAPVDEPADSANDLIDIKQQALSQLSPLVGHLDQAPEEKFRTTMMMIQASDDQTLIKTAFEAAQAITDEKERAQALLDIVNEINYFTQQHDA